MANDTKWLPEVLGRTFFGRHIWVEETYRSDPKYEWNCECGASGRGRTLASVKIKSERHVSEVHGDPDEVDP